MKKHITIIILLLLKLQTSHANLICEKLFSVPITNDNLATSQFKIYKMEPGPFMMRNYRDELFKKDIPYAFAITDRVTNQIWKDVIELAQKSEMPISDKLAWSLSDKKDNPSDEAAEINYATQPVNNKSYIMITEWMKLANELARSEKTKPIIDFMLPGIAKANIKLPSDAELQLFHLRNPSLLKQDESILTNDWLDLGEGGLDLNEKLKIIQTEDGINLPEVTDSRKISRPRIFGLRIDQELPNGNFRLTFERPSNVISK